MVIAERFAWVHVPKTGGDATYAMFAAVPGLILDSDPLDSNDKHLGFWAREAELEGKLLVMNIRRLPAWSLSAAHHKAAVGLHPDLAVDRWLRTEQIEHDVLDLLDELGLLTPEAERRVRTVGRVSEQSYERDLARRFSSQQISRMYERNPDWAAIERDVYGSLIA